MANELFKLINDGNPEKIRQILIDDPKLANEGIPCDDKMFGKKGHPLHRLCDAVFVKKITDEQAIEIAKVLLEFGSDIDGYKLRGDNNTPLIAASSLHAERLGIFYIGQGADIFYADKNDGATALHWAAYCGMNKLVGALINNGAKINQPDKSFNSTPMGWAIHVLISKDKGNLRNQLECIKILIKAGADPNLLNSESMQYLKSMAKDDKELEQLIK